MWLSHKDRMIRTEQLSVELEVHVPKNISLDVKDGSRRGQSYGDHWEHHNAKPAWRRLKYGNRRGRERGIEQHIRRYSRGRRGWKCTSLGQRRAGGDFRVAGAVTLDGEYFGSLNLRVSQREFISCRTARTWRSRVERDEWTLLMPATWEFMTRREV